MPLPFGLSANRVSGGTIASAKENADTTALIELVGLLGGAGNPLGIMFVLKQAGSTYPARPPVSDFPNVWWRGTTDPTGFASFVGEDLTTGVGDTWQQLPA